MTTEEKANYLRQKGFAPQEKVPEPVENSLNNFILSQTESDVKDEFKKAGYSIIDNGIYCLKKTANSQYLEKLSNFTASYNEKAVIEDGINTDIILKIEGVDCDGNNLPAIEVPYQQLANFSWLGKWSANCIIEPKQSTKEKLRHAVQLLSINASHKTIYKYTGWKLINNKWVFLYQGGAVGLDNICVELPAEMRKYELPQNSDLSQTLINQAFNLTKVFPKKIVLPLLAMVFLTPLNEAFRVAGREPKFTYFLYGKTGSKKSTLAALMLSFFGKFTSNGLPRCHL